MEGTSGAADLVALRGVTSEAALNPRRQTARAVCLPTVSGESRWRAQARRLAFDLALLALPLTREATTGNPCKRVDRGGSRARASRESILRDHFRAT